jgi:hypothetical protein
MPTYAILITPFPWRRPKIIPPHQIINGIKNPQESPSLENQ